MTTPGSGIGGGVSSGTDTPEFKELLKKNQTLTRDITKEYESK